MIKIYRIAFVVLALAMLAGMATAQSTTGAGQTRITKLGNGVAISMTMLSADDAARLAGQGVKTIVVPAGSVVDIAAKADQPLNVQSTKDHKATGSPGELVEMLELTGNAGQAFLISQQLASTTDKVLVIFK
jgi:hypothetical protein